MNPDPPEPDPSNRGEADVRMHGFARRVTVANAVDWIDGQVEPLSVERVPLDRASGRVLGTDVDSLVDVPGFARAMMDGFAVQAADTQGASAYHRIPLSIVGEIVAGVEFAGGIRAGQAVRIMTGAPLPAGADSVLPAEKAEVEAERVFACDAVSPGKHVGARGEDIAAGSRVLARGRRLRPQDLGILASIGLAELTVVRQPRVRVIVTGDELLPPGATLTGARIADANGPMLTALAERDGALVSSAGIVSDRPDAILRAMSGDVDVVLVSGGSSVGQEDHAPVVLARHGELAIHGIAMRPSSPAGMGRLGRRLVFLLPGNPVSCLCAYDFFAGRAIRSLGGRAAQWPYPIIRLPLRRKLISVVGRVDYARVSLIDGQVEPITVGGASRLSSTTRADGFVVVPEDSEGYPPATEVDVFLYDLP